MKVLVGSDFHGKLSAYSRFASTLAQIGDIAILAGDLTSRMQKHAIQEDKIKTILRKPGKPVLFIMGNMDGQEFTSDDIFFNLNLSEYRINNYSFIGYHYTNPFVGKVFVKSEDKQAADFQTMPYNDAAITVLVTHGPPFGLLDRTSSGIHAGSKALRDFINERNPNYHLFGHIHEAWGQAGTSYNVAYQESKSYFLIDLATNQSERIRCS